MSTRISASGQHYTKSFGVTDGCTIVMWVKMSVNRAAVTGLFGFSGPTTDFSLTTQSDGTGLQYKWGGSSFGTGQTLVVSTWHRVGIIHTVSSTPISYFGGPTGALTATTVTGAPWGAMTSFKIGCEYITTSAWFNGCYANFKAWDATLTVAEMTAEFLVTQPQRWANIAHYHPFIGADTVDYSGLNRNLGGGSGAASEAGPPIPIRARNRYMMVPPGRPAIGKNIYKTQAVARSYNY